MKIAALKPLAGVNIIRFLMFMLAVGVGAEAVGLLLLFFGPYRAQVATIGVLGMLLVSALLEVVDGVLGVAAACLLIRWGRPRRFVEWISECPAP